MAVTEHTTNGYAATLKASTSDNKVGLIKDVHQIIAVLL